MSDATPPRRESDPASKPDHRGDLKHYWRRNLQLVGILLVVWFSVSYLAGIVFVDELDQIRLGGFKLGFWFAQQGSIYTFVVLIVVYVVLMNRLDIEHGVEEHDEDEVREGGPP